MIHELKFSTILSSALEGSFKVGDIVLRYVIYIETGVYNETVRIPKEKTNLMFLGDGSNATIITGNLHVQSPGITTWLSATVGE